MGVDRQCIGCIDRVCLFYGSVCDPSTSHLLVAQTETLCTDETIPAETCPLSPDYQSWLYGFDRIPGRAKNRPGPLGIVLDASRDER